MAEYIFTATETDEKLFSFRNGYRERIVRCKDCKFINRYDMSCRRWSHDNGVCYMAKHVSDYGFCAWAEPKEDKTDDLPVQD